MHHTPGDVGPMRPGAVKRTVVLRVHNTTQRNTTYVGGVV